MPAFYKGYKCFAHKVTFAKWAKQPLQKGDARCKEAERCGDWKRETQTWQENLWEREKQQASNSPSELVGPWQAFSSHLQVVSRTSNAGWLHPPRGLWCSKGREPWPLSWLCAQGPHGQVCQGCFCVWANAGPSPASQPQILEKGQGRSSSDPSTHAILQFGNTAQLQWIFSNSTAGTILANPWKKRWSSFGRAPHEDQELEKKNHHSTLCPWGWCSICQQQFFNGLVLGCLDDMLQLLAKQVLDLLLAKVSNNWWDMEWFAGGGLLVIQCSPQWLPPLSWFWWCTFEKRDRLFPFLQTKGSPFFANKGKPLENGYKGVVWAVMGDADFFALALGLPHWASKRPCYELPPALPIRESISKNWKLTPKPSQGWPMHMHWHIPAPQTPCSMPSQGCQPNLWEVMRCTYALCMGFTHTSWGVSSSTCAGSTLGGKKNPLRSG